MKLSVAETAVAMGVVLLVLGTTCDAGYRWGVHHVQDKAKQMMAECDKQYRSLPGDSVARMLNDSRTRDSCYASRMPFLEYVTDNSLRVIFHTEQ